ncbi:MAG TPA: LamG domain-containing protein [Candidatus Saccharimonadales bacterium]|nr:LamG domain-containing protein [Candidatus Saccharimonadales bacterium]
MLGSARSVLIKKPSVTLPSALAAYGFSEGSGTTTADSSGNGNTLTLNSTTWTTGHTGGGITNTSTGQGAGRAFVGPSAAITMMAWIQPLDLPVGGSRLAMGLFQTGGNTDVAIFTERGDFGSPNVLQCDLRIAGSLNAIHGPALTVGVWTHVAITFNGSIARLYVNGSQFTSSSISGTLSTGDRLTVAGTDPGNSYDSDVIVDDARLFATALDGAQVSFAMATPVS